MKKGLFGKDTVNIAGHKVPYALLGALAAILGAFLIWKFNQSGGAVIGATPSAVDLSGLNNGVTGTVDGLPPPTPTPPAPAGPASLGPLTLHQREWLKIHPGASAAQLQAEEVAWDRRNH